MKEYKNIDDLFRQGMSGLKTEPSDGVWKNIEAGYFKGRGFIVKWYHMAALALLLIFSGTTWYYYSQYQTDSDNISENQISNQSNPEDQNRLPVGETEMNKEAFSDGSLGEDQPVMLIAETGNDGENISETSALSGKDDNSEKQNELTDIEEEKQYRYQSIYSINSQSIDLDNDAPVVIIDPENVPGLKEYLKKQKHTHFYTGASVHAGMVYYPSTKDQFTWSADLAFGLKAGKIYIETGVGYESMKERGTYLIELKSYDSVGFYNRVESFEINSQNPNDIIYNTKQVAVYDSINHYTHTTPLFEYDYVNVPLLVGFRFLEKKKFTVSANTGVIFNFLVQKEFPDSDFYNPDFTIVQTRNVTPERVDWNLRWQLGLRMNYNIVRSLSVSAEPVFTKYLNSVYDTGKGYPNVKPYTMGVRIGIYYGF